MPFLPNYAGSDRNLHLKPYSLPMQQMFNENNIFYVGV